MPLPPAIRTQSRPSTSAGEPCGPSISSRVPSSSAASADVKSPIGAIVKLGRFGACAEEA